MKYFYLALATSLWTNKTAAGPMAISNVTQDMASRGAGIVNSVYFPNWGTSETVHQLPIDKINRILYAFANVAADGSVIPGSPEKDVREKFADDIDEPGNNAYGLIKQVYQLKKKHRHVKVQLSIGGWSFQSNFVSALTTVAGRETFARTAVKLMGDWGMDGLDIDWEFPDNSKQAAQLLDVVRLCRNMLDAYAAKYAPGYHFLLTIASPAGPGNYAKLHLDVMDPFLDNWNLMAYDYMGSWSKTAGHQANLFPNTLVAGATALDTNAILGGYFAKGVPSHKIVLGIPLYGRSFSNTTGLGAPSEGVGNGEKDHLNYKLLPKSGAIEHYDDLAKASYSYNPVTRELISYDNVLSARHKAAFIHEKGLGGAFFWDATGDKFGSESVVSAVGEVLGNLKHDTNLVNYPGSQYNNIRFNLA